MSAANPKGTQLSVDELNSQSFQNKDFFEKNDIMRILYLIRYYNPENDITELAENLNIDINENDLKPIEYFTLERSLIDEENMKKINKDIILFRNDNKFKTREEKKK